eukprot:CAMPEP_0119335568 /NCGR_PEP_ID=MMETSP1333-20130426/89858_1 /TAXON_ID=418940 /ORGANISM="Scyphosphaera apsteinii, Strain RCC1455" /LENGTH=101 /DNA_ID=CAMNT_0007346151 /DNA_START=376 /DNA_END=677 /DNA_ORIENTATION=-
MAIQQQPIEAWQLGRKLRPFVVAPQNMFMPEAEGCGPWDLRPVLKKQGGAQPFQPNVYPEDPAMGALRAAFFDVPKNVHYPDQAMIGHQLEGFRDLAEIPL